MTTKDESSCGNKILFMSNMYPSSEFPSFGTFVKTNEEHLVSSGNEIIKKVVIDKKGGGRISKVVRYCNFIVNGFISILFSNYDYIYAHYLTHTTIPILLAMPFKRFIFFINIHGDDLSENTWRHSLMSLWNSLLVRKAKGIILPSESFKNIFMRKYPGINPRKIHVSHSGGINLSNFSNKKKYFDKRDFFYISRIEEGKGWEALLDAVKIVKENCITKSEIIVNVYGYGNQLPIFLEKISNLKLCNNIIYHGQIEHSNVPDVFNDAKFFIFPTQRESLGLVLLESMACGTPAIVSDIDPINIIANEKSCLFFKVNDCDDLSKKLLEALDISSERYARMCEESLRISLDYSDEKSKYEISRFLKNACKD